ncbi:MAG: ribbon-helix-helix domain-containing protein [Gammaproteobacteria bacterium]
MPHARPGRAGQTNVTGYFPPVVKRLLRTIAVERDTTIQDLLAEALNDLFAKYGKPEVASSRRQVRPEASGEGQV